jgi:SAM-dependent methyltransferase
VELEMISKTQAGLVYHKPKGTEWPTGDLEYLGVCPVCGTAERTLAFQGLQDKIFFCAPGKWTSWHCSSCNVVYLDPRPTTGSIHAAYESYYTHRPSNLSILQKLLHWVQIGIRHSYMNKWLGYRLKTALPFGWLAYVLNPTQISVTHNTIRDLPPPAPGRNRLLDIGCGDGEFLFVARELGYDVLGVEIDPVARKIASEKGLDVHPSPIPGSSLPTDHFNQITLSHVAEHFHDPVSALREVFSLLHPGGRVWIQVPNSSAFSIERFGINSRLLEPPRHLVMFSSDSLKKILENIGFKAVTLLGSPSFRDHGFVYGQSWMIEQGLDPYANPESIVPKDIQIAADAAYDAPEGKTRRSEIITITAVKLL